MSTTLSGRQRLLLALYPPSFRSRYGAELETLVTDSGWSRRVALDLLLGAARAWMRPIFPADAAGRGRRRLEATTATVFVAWCAALVAIGAFSRGVDDSPLPGLEIAPASALYRVAEVAFSITALVLVAGLLFYASVAIVPALRARHRRVWLPVAVPLLATVAWWLGSIGVSGLVQHYWTGNSHSTDSWLRALLSLLLLGWIAAGGLCLAGCAIGGPVALARARLRPRLLVPGAIGGIVIALGIAVSSVSAGLCLVALAGHNPPQDLLIPAGGVSLLMFAAVIGGTSAARGLSALVTTGIPRPRG